MLHIITNAKNNFKIKSLVLFIIIIAVGCQGNSEKPGPKTNSDSKVLKNENTNGRLINLEKKILLIQAQLDINSRLIDSNYVNNKEIKNKYDNNIIEQDYLNILNKIQKKIQILEDRTFYTDSLYFEIMTDMVMMENKISSLLLSFQEINDLENNKSINLLPQITDEEYTQKYIDALADYQNAEWENSLNGFGFLIHVNKNHDLADNCQYWIGEIYYALMDYEKSINEFGKVFSFPNTNKGDDAQFKMGLCYMNIGKIDEAIIEFKKILNSYPNSEYYVRAKNYINQY